MKFSLLDNGDKGLYLRQSLEAAGHKHVEWAGFSAIDLILLDCDWSWAPQRPEIIRAAAQHGVKVALYPHGGQWTGFVYDGLTEPMPEVDLRLEHGPGAAEIAEMLALDLKQQTPGWLYSPTAPFAPVTDPKRVLFAPMHPNIEAMQNGGPDIAPALNQHAYRQLLDLDFETVVSVVGPHWRNGVWAHPRVTFTENPEMRLTEAMPLVASADVVIAGGTLAALAVALGRPLVMVGPDNDCCDYIGGRYVRAARADEYEDILRYPLNAEDGPLLGLIQKACEGSREVLGWRERWIGDDGTAAAVRGLEDLVGDASRNASDQAGKPPTHDEEPRCLSRTT